MAIKQRDARDEQPTCEVCLDRKNATRRHVHYLQFGDESALAGHLTAQLGHKAADDGTVTALLAWVRATQDRYCDMADEQGERLPIWQAWARANYHTAKNAGQAPRSEAGRLFAAKVWDRLADAYGKPISPYVRDEFLAELNAGEAEPRTAAGPLAEDLAAALAGGGKRMR